MGLRYDFKMRWSDIPYLINVSEIPTDYLAPWSVPSISAQQMRGANFLGLGPLAILDQVKGLAHLYSITLWTFIYFKNRKMRHF